MSIASLVLAAALLGQRPAIVPDGSGGSLFLPYPSRPDVRYGLSEVSRPASDRPCPEYVPLPPEPAGWPGVEWPPRRWSSSDAGLDWIEWALGGRKPAWATGDRP